MSTRKYIPVKALNTSGSGDGACFGCVAMNMSEDDTTLDLCHDLLHRYEKENIGQSSADYYCFNTIWIADTDKAKAEYVALRLGAPLVNT